MKKRLASLFLALALCLGLCVPALAANFSDVPDNHTFRDAIYWAADQGIVGGYMNGTFKPSNTVAKSHFCAMLARAFYPDEIAQFDTPETMQTYGTFGKTNMTLAANGTLENTSFSNTYLTEAIFTDIDRYDMAQLMTNIMNKAGFAANNAEKQAAIEKIEDYNKVPAKYQDAIANVYALGIIGGYADGAFHGDGVMNRGQAAVVIYRMMQRMQGNTENNTGNQNKPVETPESKPEIPETKPIETTKPETPETKPVEIPEVPEIPEIIEKPETPVQPTEKTLSNGKAITETNVEEMLNELKAKYPEGTSFANGYRAGANSTDVNKAVQSYRTNTGRYCSTTGGCGAWAALVSDYIFGQTGAPARKVALTDARPGDIGISLDGNGRLRHVFIVTSHAWHDDYSESTQIDSTDAGDHTGTYIIYWTMGHAQWDNLQPNDYTLEIWTRYPD